LKLKEISYIHAEGYAAGEMKHGPIALVTDELPVICVATQGETYEKIVSNIQEIKARAGLVITSTSFRFFLSDENRKEKDRNP
jgi:glutamine---fructose-6-phosphate transaminase (isomerizing)